MGEISRNTGATTIIPHHRLVRRRRGNRAEAGAVPRGRPEKEIRSIGDVTNDVIAVGANERVAAIGIGGGRSSIVNKRLVVVVVVPVSVFRRSFLVACGGGGVVVEGSGRVVPEGEGRPGRAPVWE